MTNSKSQILVEVFFYKEGEKSRKSVPNLANRIYRPHFIVEGTQTYLGVWFVEGDLFELGMKANAIVETIYDGVDYSLLLQPETEFEIAEGGNIVGKGKVIEQLINRSSQSVC